MSLELTQEIIRITIQLNYYWNFLGLVNNTKNFLPLDIEFDQKVTPHTLKITLIPLSEAQHELVFFAVGSESDLTKWNVYVFRPGQWVSKLREYVQTMSSQQHEPIDDTAYFSS